MSLHENVRIVEQPTDLLTLTPRYTQRALQIIETVATGNATTPNPAGLGPLSPAPLRGQPFTLFVHYEESHVPLFAAPGYQNTSTRGAYGDMTAQMDGSVAIIMEALERHGLMNSTMVLLSSDNGAWIDPSSGLPGARGTAQDGGSNGPLRVSRQVTACGLRWSNQRSIGLAATPAPGWCATLGPASTAPLALRSHVRCPTRCLCRPVPRLPLPNHRRAARAPLGREAWSTPPSSCRLAACLPARLCPPRPLSWM